MCSETYKSTNCVSYGYYVDLMDDKNALKANTIIESMKKILGTNLGRPVTSGNRNDIKSLRNPDFMEFISFEDIMEYPKEQYLGFLITFREIPDTEEITVTLFEQAQIKDYERRAFSTLLAEAVADAKGSPIDISFTRKAEDKTDGSAQSPTDLQFLLSKKDEIFLLMILLLLLKDVIVSSLSVHANELEKKLHMQMTIMGMTKSAYVLSNIIFDSSLMLTLLTFSYGVGSMLKIGSFNIVSLDVFVLVGMLLFAAFLSQSIALCMLFSRPLLIFIMLVLSTISSFISVGVLHLCLANNYGILLRILNLACSVPMTRLIILLMDLSSELSKSGGKTDVFLLMAPHDFCLDHRLMEVVNGIILYLSVMTYLSYIVPWKTGRSLPPWFVFTPYFWDFPVWPKSKPSTIDSNDEDLLAEHALASAHEPNVFCVDDISKTHTLIGLPANLLSMIGISSKKAVNGLSLAAQKGEVFVLLGHNGAGKSTAMNVISGNMSWDSGNIYYDGADLQYRYNDFKGSMGICPQHDVLFPEFTPNEHIEIFAGLRVMSERDMKAQTEELLAAFKLTKVANKAVSQFSGGMKRRVSLLLSMLGNPKVLLVDEPTTGMDPINRRHVWDYICEFKKTSVVLFTTHSMEEAEVVGDKIGIMREGQMCAVGTSTHLKHRLANGYRLVISMNPGIPEERLISFVMTRLPNSVVESMSLNSGRFLVPAETVPAMFKLFSDFPNTTEESEIVKDWGFSQMSLSDVFHVLTKDHYDAPPLPLEEMIMSDMVQQQ